MCSHLALIAGADATHSASKQAGATDKLITVDTTSLSNAKTFAVCYTEADGDTGATWIDSGIRVVMSKLGVSP